MQHQEHVSLIKDLDAKVRSGPAPDAFQASYFQACWALIKRIGPTFRETPYPSQRERDQSFARFQTLVNHVKDHQAAFEKNSAAIAEELLAALEKARPPAMAGDMPTSMADLVGPEETAAAGEDTPESTQDETPAAPLTELSELCNKILDTFMGSRPRLTPADYKRVSDAVREVRRQLQKAFDGHRERRRERQAARAETGAPKAPKTQPAAGETAAASAGTDETAEWRRKQEAFRRKVRSHIRRDEDCLVRETDVLAGIRKSIAAEREPVRLKRLRDLEEASAKNIAMIEAELVRSREVLAGIERQLTSAGA